MQTEQIEQVRKIIDIAARCKTMIAASILLGFTLGLVFYLLQPKAYQSTTLLSYQQQKVNPAKMSPDVEARIRDTVSTLTQIVTSRTSLERIITEIDLYKEERQNLPMEDVVEMMRRNISIDPSKQGDTFRISFIGSAPNQVARVTNALAARFIEENLKYREERASETSAYTQEELDMAKGILDQKEAVMRDYKLKYYNEMPDQRTNNMSRLNALQEQYQNRQNSIQDLERTRVMIQDQINVRKQLLAENEQLRRVLTANREQTPQPESGRARLERLQAQLQSLLGRYTEQHPEVRQLRRQIGQLEQEVAAGDGGQTSGDQTVEQVDGQLDKVLVELQLQLKEIGLGIAKLDKEKEDLKELIEQYEAWVSAAPVREAEWSALTREYGELKRHYDFLVSQNLQARSALNLERTQRGSQFKIEDPARQAEKPIKPDFVKIMAVALMLGAGLGGGLALGLEMINQSCRSPQDLENTFQLEVLCTVPYLSLAREVKRQKLWTIGGALVFSLWAAGVVAAFIYFWQQGRIVF